MTITYAAWAALVADFQAKTAAADVGGQLDTAAFKTARDAVVAALRQIAEYITSLGLTNASDVLSSGFDIVLPGKNPQPPPKVGATRTSQDQSYPRLIG
jgi:hypothetical protein